MAGVRDIADEVMKHMCLSDGPQTDVVLYSEPVAGAHWVGAGDDDVRSEVLYRSPKSQHAFQPFRPTAPRIFFPLARNKRTLTMELTRASICATNSHRSTAFCTGKRDTDCSTTRSRWWITSTSSKVLTS